MSIIRTVALGAAIAVGGGAVYYADTLQDDIESQQALIQAWEANATDACERSIVHSALNNEFCQRAERLIVSHDELQRRLQEGPVERIKSTMVYKEAAQAAESIKQKF